LNIGQVLFVGHVGFILNFSGVSGEGTFFGCDHHNLGCTCDFCIQNKPLSDDAKRRNIFNYGLDLHFLKWKYIYF